MRRLAILDDNQRLLERRIERLRAALPVVVARRVCAAVVIGSVAEGRARDESDLDVVLVLGSGSPTRADYAWWDREVEALLRPAGDGRFPLQPVFIGRAALTTTEPHLRRALDTGIVLMDPEGLLGSVTNVELARDYFTRAQKRLKAVAVLMDEAAFADVVRESQEVVELLLKAVLRHFGIAVPFSHEPSQAFTTNVERLPLEVQGLVPRWTEISRRLRRDRELAFYGSEDITPSTFYTAVDAAEAQAMAEEILADAGRWLTAFESPQRP